MMDFKQTNDVFISACNELFLGHPGNLFLKKYKNGIVMHAPTVDIARKVATVMGYEYEIVNADYGTKKYPRLISGLLLKDPFK